MKGPFETVVQTQPTGCADGDAPSVFEFRSNALLLSGAKSPTFFDGLETSGRVLTLDGEVTVGDLQAGDFVLGTDGRYHEIIWGYRENRSIDELAQFASRRSILISAHALGAGQPGADTIVGPDQLVSVASDRALELFGERRVLVKAQELLALKGVYQVPPADTAVVHLVFDTATTILVNGLGVIGCCMTDDRIASMSHVARDALTTEVPRLGLTAGRISQEPRGTFLGARELAQVYCGALRQERATEEVVTPLRLVAVQT